MHVILLHKTAIPENRKLLLLRRILLDGWIYKDESGFPFGKTFAEMTKAEEKASWRFVGLSLLLAIPLIAVAAWLYYF